MTNQATNISTITDHLGISCVPEFDSEPESCPACGDTIDAFHLELSRADTALCSCPHCGVMVAA